MLSYIEKTGILGVEVKAGNIMLHWSSKPNVLGLPFLVLEL